MIHWDEFHVCLKQLIFPLQICLVINFLNSFLLDQNLFWWRFPHFSTEVFLLLWLWSFLLYSCKNILPYTRISQTSNKNKNNNSHNVVSKFIFTKGKVNVLKDKSNFFLKICTISNLYFYCLVVSSFYYQFNLLISLYVLILFKTKH